MEFHIFFLSLHFFSPVLLNYDIINLFRLIHVNKLSFGGVIRAGET